MLMCDHSATAESNFSTRCTDTAHAWLGVLLSWSASDGHCLLPVIQLRRGLPELVVIASARRSGC